MSLVARLTRGIDHVTFGTRDLDRAQNTLAALGLSHTPVAQARWPQADGPHRARTVSVMLPDGYLDVVEFPAAPAELEPTGVVWTAENLANTRARMIEAGIRCARPYTIARCFEGAGPDQRYEIFGIEPKHANGLPQSLIETLPAPPMQNRSPHSADVTSMAEALRLLGVELVPS
jgi:hypothetical protein